MPPGSATALGVAGRAGAARSPVAGLNRAKPCWVRPFTVVNSPPTNSWLPSVAITRGPRPAPFGPPLVLGYQLPTRPPLVLRESRCRDRPRPQPTSGKASGSLPWSALQSWLCEPV